jgi:ribosome recycling factor
MAMIDEVLAELDQATERARDALKRELGRLRTGRAHTGLLEGLRVDYYGQSTPIAQMATIAIPEPRLMTVKPWDRSQVQAVDKALRESDLGFNPIVQGDLIRIPVPPLSEERRRELVKVAKREGEECKVSIRRARHEALDMLGEMKKSGDASEDEVDRAKKKVEEAVAEAVKDVDRIVQSKEKDILTV